MKSKEGGEKYVWKWWKSFHQGKNSGWSALSFPFGDKKETAMQKIRKTSRGIIVGLLPKVFAQEVVEARGPKEKDELMTISDRLAKEKPKVMVSDSQVQEFLEQETGRDRLNAMFSRDINGNPSPEMQFVLTSSVHCGGLTFLLFSILGGRVGRDRFVEENKHTKFLTRFRAARAYNDAIILAGMKEGARWGFRLACFSGLFLVTSQSIAVYRNKSSMLEYLAAGVVTCSFLRMNMGIKGMVASGVMGAVLGLIGGTVIYGGQYMLNETQEQRHYWMVQDILKKKGENLLLSESDPATVSST